MRMRPISSTSRKPRVVISPVLAPDRCRMVLEPTVVPCSTSSTLARGDAELLQQRLQPGHHGAARIVRRGRHLALVQDAVAGHDDDVRECAPDVDGDPHAPGSHERCFPKSRSRECMYRPLDKLRRGVAAGTANPVVSLSNHGNGDVRPSFDKLRTKVECAARFPPASGELHARTCSDGRAEARQAARHRPR